MPKFGGAAVQTVCLFQKGEEGEREMGREFEEGREVKGGG